MAVIRANRESIDDRFSVLGFTVRSELPLFEIGLATDPELLKPANRGKRTPANFFSSRLLRALPSQRGEAVFLVPPEAVARFVGQPRLYFGLATYRESDRNTPVSLRLPDRGSMYVSMSGLTERGLRRTARRSTPNGYGYNTGGGELGWGGDAAGTPPAPSRDEDRARTAGAKAPTAANEPATYSDGYSEELWKAPPTASAPAPAPAPASAPTPAPAPSATTGASAQSMSYGYGRALSDDGDDDAHDIGGPIPDAYTEAQSYRGARGLALTAPEYPNASRFEAANTGNYRAVSGTRTIDKIVIHITDGSANINGTIGWFKNPAAKVSAHYVIGQDGEVVQMVAHNDVAWHAGSANGTSIGIEHVANTKGLNPTVRQMEASAALVTWLCDKFGIDPVRANILGHAEADKKTTHTACPNAVWNWDYYMQLISTRSSVPAPPSMPLSYRQQGYGRALSDDGDDDAHDIGGPIPDAYTEAQSYRGARGLALTAPEYPGARRYEPANTGNYRAVSGTRTIDKIVIHITDGGANINGTISWFKNADAKVSAHYVIGQDGEVVQMVANNDVAWHAGSANGTSIGIEHVANTKGLNPTVRQMEASSALVVWLCDKYGIDPTRANILGHAEADKKTTHTACPNAVWNWDYYMQLISTRSCVTPPASMPLSYSRAMEEEEDPDQFGISSDEPESFEGPGSLGYSAGTLGTQKPDYPGASRFAPAHAKNFRVGRKRGVTLDRIVIHITAGGPKIDGTIGWFQNPDARVSSHYIVGRDGEVVQMVRDADTAYHASSANSRSIGIEHNANKPYKLNKRDLPPTERQYEESANLVAWLCAEHGITPDRDHIIGHIEASPGDNHDCPSGYWNWNHYMTYVDAAVAALASRTAPAAQSLGMYRRDYARAQEIITPFYDPKDPSSALVCQDDAFSQAREEWFAGVDNTSMFPHSAICLLEMSDSSGSKSFGTGFYIGRNRLLTCAHNLSGKSSVTVIPGKNGAGTGTSNEPFGRCTVTSSAWRVAPGYTGNGNWANDLAVIDNLPIAAPFDQWFEFLNATPSNKLPLVVCGYSRKSDAVPALSALMDGNKQHLHGGYSPGQSNPEVIEYPILTLHRASGSPVYTLTDSGSGLRALICAVHVSGAPAAQGLNRGCFITPTKIDWIEGRASTFSLGYAGNVRALGNDGPSDHAVHLIPQPDKNACWAASMAMLLAFRNQTSRTPESVINAIGGSLASSYDWELLKAARKRYGFEMIEQPSNASLYHTPRQWAEWLNTYGPLWVVIVGAPHAVVIAGIKGNLDDANSTQVKILNPWDTRIAFDNDAIDFHPANHGYEDWLPFADFASDFGTMAESNYGNWRILHLPASAVQAQSLSANGVGLRLAAPPPTVRSLNADGERREPIEPSRVAGTHMSRVIGEAGACRWTLDQLEGMKSPTSPAYEVSSAASGTVKIALDNWPAIEGAPTPLPLTVEFRHGNGSVGDVRIVAGMPANLAYGIEVSAKIEDCADDGKVARVRVRVDYRFRGLAQGNPDAVVELCLRGDGQYERENGWSSTSNTNAPNALSPAA